METEHLNEFLVMSRQCNYTLAADELFLSQPTLFKHIKSLETEIGTPLFEKKGKGLALTEAGRMLTSHAETILAERAQYMKEVGDLIQRKAHTLRFGSNYKSRDFLIDFHTEQPDYKILLCSSRSIDTAFNKDKCDVVMMCLEDEPDRNKYDSFLFYSEEVVVATYSTHPLAHRLNVKLEDLRNEDFVGIAASGSDFLTPAFQYSGANNVFEPNIVITAENGSSAINLVSKGFGITFIFRDTLSDEEKEHVSLLKLNPEKKCGVYICWKKNKPLSEGAIHFIDYIKGCHR